MKPAWALAPVVAYQNKSRQLLADG